MRKIKQFTSDESALTSVLKTIPSPPNSLYSIGYLPENRPPCVAIVGTRKPTTYGREVSYRFAYDLAKAGICVISGLAFGVDAIAHRGALDANGTTIAVLAGGLHRIYPVAHENLAQEIVRSGGALLSEKAPGEDARRYDFLARNRLVSGLADIIIVTEAAEKSGTLSTVAHAIEQNKEVFAVPGPITSVMSIGPNRLIQQGASPALEARDILQRLIPNKPTQQHLFPEAKTPLEQTITSLIATGVRDGDELLQRSNVDASQFLQAMTMLEINDIIKPLGGNQWTLQ